VVKDHTIMPAATPTDFENDKIIAVFMKTRMIKKFDRITSLVVDIKLVYNSVCSHYFTDLLQT